MLRRVRLCHRSLLRRQNPYTHGDTHSLSLHLLWSRFPWQVRCCDAKIPESMRDGLPFEEILQRWLQLVFVPTYRQLLKDKARGVVKKAI